MWLSFYSVGFPVNVMCLLPYMVQHYEEPTPICTEAADNIAQVFICGFSIIYLAVGWRRKIQIQAKVL